MNNLKIKATKIFQQVMNSQNKVIILRGGAGSSKSYSVMQVIVYRFLSMKNLKILILRKSAPVCRNTCLPVFKEILSSFGMQYHKPATGNIIEFEKQPMEFHHHANKNIVKFSGLDDPEKLKSSEHDYIIFEEATEFEYEDYQQAKLRLRRTNRGHQPQIIMMFNPVSPFVWIKERLIDQKEEDFVEIVSSYKDNPFLAAEWIADLENSINIDPNWHRIYALGKWGSLAEKVYKDFEIVEPEKFPKSHVLSWAGLDWGWNSPTAIVLHSLKNEERREIYEKEILYRRKMTVTDVIDFLIKIKFRKTIPIVCDSAEPDKIAQLKQQGFNAIPAEKDRTAGIDFCKSLTYFITADSENLQKEHKAYSYKKGKDGYATDEIVKEFDHLMDARRYCDFTFLYKRIGQPSFDMNIDIYPGAYKLPRGGSVDVPWKSIGNDLRRVLHKIGF